MMLEIMRLLCSMVSSSFGILLKMGTKITASVERLFRLQAVSKDDTIYLFRIWYIFGYMLNRSVLVTPGGFAYCFFINRNSVSHRIVQAIFQQ